MSPSAQPPTATTVASAMPIVLGGQKVFITAESASGMTILRTGRLDCNDLPTKYSMQFNTGIPRR